MLVLGVSGLGLRVQGFRVSQLSQRSHRTVRAFLTLVGNCELLLGRTRETP